MKRGFSLVEALIVLVILGLLVAICIPVFQRRPAATPAKHHAERVRVDGITIGYVVTTENGDRYLISREGGAPVKLP